MFDIIKNRKIVFLISGVIILAGIISMFVQGFNMDIDFTGGTVIQIALDEPFTREMGDKIAQSVEAAAGIKPSSVQKTGEGDKEVIIKTKEISSDMRDKVFEQVKTDLNLSATAPLKTDNVSPSVGNDLKKSAVMASVIAAVLMLVYIWIRFELKTGLSAVLCLLHDILVILAFYSIFQMPMSTNFIAAILTILGYSINATIVVFDRVRENMKLSRKEDFKGLVNKSIWQTMNRSVFTSLTTVIMVVFLYIFGVESIKDFSLPIIIGIVAGTYSSVFLSGNIWVLLRRKK